VAVNTRFYVFAFSKNVDLKIVRYSVIEGRVSKHITQLQWRLVYAASVVPILASFMDISLFYDSEIM